MSSRRANDAGAITGKNEGASTAPLSCARQRLAATPHPLFLQRTLVSRKRAKIGARAGPIWHYDRTGGRRKGGMVGAAEATESVVRPQAV